MKVLKFGGTSVGTARSILNVKQIVETNNEEVIVVVSALGGITDKLILTSQLAMNGDIAYKKEMNEIISRHLSLISEIIPVSNAREELVTQVNVLLYELHAIYEEVYNTRILAESQAASIVSYGERMSSLIASRLIKDAVWFDSLSFIKTRRRHQHNELEAEVTHKLISKAFSQLPKVALVPGFISTDAVTGEITNLGRGGSDYTAAILAAALEADCLEIWTDVDGFMTADPRVVPAATPIEELSYNEAEELSKFGAKVIYPPTIYPVWHQRIPIYIKNTMNPEAPGTVIKQHIHQQANTIKGISFVREACLFDFEIGDLSRSNNKATCFISSFEDKTVSSDISWLVRLLTENGISPLLLNCKASNHSIHLGIRKEDEAHVCELLNKIQEIKQQLILKEIKHNLAALAIVGEKVPIGFYTELYEELRKEGIDVISSNLGDTAITHSFMIHKEKLMPALEEAHNTIFHPAMPVAM